VILKTSTDIGILAGLNVFSFFQYGKVDVEMSSFSMYVCGLAPEQINKFYSYSVLKSFSIIGRSLVNMNVIGP
jgi:hypothetical protein